MGIDGKRFDNWEHVDCNDCSHYWDSSCDGVSKGSRVGCNSFLATRSIVLPERLNKLEERFEKLRVGCILTDIILMLLLVNYILGWYIG